MKIRCIKCEQVKELNSSELQEVGTFVESRKLRAVGFLKFLSLDMREGNLCKDGREHQWEYDEGFDKEVHMVAKNCNNAEKGILDSEKEVSEYELKIGELIEKRDIAQKVIETQKELLDKGREILKEIAWIGDPKLWS